jgi:hypothetical protein
MSRVRSIFRARRTLSLCAAAVLWLTFAAPAWACPMCKFASESTARQPRAYMYSVLFMMGMPAVLSTGFGLGFYRLSRKAARMQQESLAAWEDSFASDCLGDEPADEAHK